MAYKRRPVSGFSRSLASSQSHTCKQCGETELNWFNTAKGWRLAKDREVHVCKPEAQRIYQCACCWTEIPKGSICESCREWFTYPENRNAFMELKEAK